jgi:arylsulfatase A
VQNTKENAFALRQGDWMFIDAKTGQHSKSPDWFNKERGYTKDSTPGLLYNLKEDPAQHKNLYASHPEKVAEMKALLDRYKDGEGCAPHAK